MIELEYDTPIEITEEQFHYVINHFGGIVAAKKDEETGKYLMKIWLMKYKLKVEEYLNGSKS